MYKSIKRWFKRPSNPSGNLYYARLSTPQGKFYKLGYTSKSSLTERMAYGGKGDEKLVDCIFLFSFRNDAWDVEQILLDHFQKFRVFGEFSNNPAMPLAGRGQSELFAHDILGLDEDLYRHAEQNAIALSREEMETSKNGCLMVLLGVALIPFTLGFSLFFILGGGSDIFKSTPSQRQTNGRPQHPPEIKSLIDALVNRHRASSAA